MRRIAVMPYGPSHAARNLVEALREGGANALRIRSINSIFKGRDSDIIVNYGSSNINDMDRVSGSAMVINHPRVVRNASNKVRAFEAMARHGVPVVEYTTLPQVAQEWFNEGNVVYARQTVNGHSGAGIVICSQSTPDQMGNVAFEHSLANAALYTKGLTAQRREFRFHVMNGEIIFVQQKRRVADWRELPNYSNVVRNHSTGWIYAQQDVRPNEASRNAAIQAVNALGLDFGAVDIITRHDQAWVLEVNTAPGLEGETLVKYAENLRAISEGDNVTPFNFDRFDDPSIAEVAEVVAAPTPVNGGFYPAHIGSFATIVEFDEATNSYYRIGSDVPMRMDDVDLRVNLNNRIFVDTTF